MELSNESDSMGGHPICLPATYLVAVAFRRATRWVASNEQPATYLVAVAFRQATVGVAS